MSHPADIITLVAACDRGVAETRAWSNAIAQAIHTTDANTRLCIAATHRLDAVERLWAQRRPGVPLTEAFTVAPAELGPDPLGSLAAWILTQRVRITELGAGVDQRVDPATADTVRRITAELDDLAQQLGDPQ